MINPDAGNLGGKIGFIFGSFSMVLFVMGFFLFPETKGMTFAELDYLFAKKTPSWRFKSAVEQMRAGGITGDVETMEKDNEECLHVEVTEMRK